MNTGCRYHMQSMSLSSLVIPLFKAAVCKFCLFVAISVWKPGIAAGCGIIFLVWYVLQHGSTWMNLTFWGECVAVSHRTGVDVYCTSQSQILAYVLKYMT